ncbi:MAG: anti-sigma factor [Chloroflexota bacterium]
MTGPHGMTCEEVDSLAGLAALDALEPTEAVEVRDHLQDCPKAHAALAELAPLATALATAVPPEDAPAGLRERTLAAIATTAQIPDAAIGGETGSEVSAGKRPAAGPQPVVAQPAQDERPADGGGSWFSRHRWALGGVAAALAIVLVAVGVGNQLQRAADTEARLTVLRWAIVAASDPTSNVAVLDGSGVAEGASGFAVFPADRDGYIVVGKLPEIPDGQTYQAWYLSDGVPTSAGLIVLSDDGLGILTDLDPAAGTDTIALTVEALPGAGQPTSTPVVVGELATATAMMAPA